MDLAERTVNTANSFSASTANETLDCLLRVASFIRLRLGEFLDQFELTEVRYSVLASLSSAGARGLSQSELAERLMQSESNVSTLIERMSQVGLVDRLRSHADRRKRVLLLSATGATLVERVEAAKSHWAVRQLQGVPADDRSTLGVLLGQLAESQAVRTGLKLVPSVSLRVSMTLQQVTRHDEHGSSVQSSWAEPGHDEEGESEGHSPHRALEQMLSALGLVNQLVKDEA